MKAITSLFVVLALTGCASAGNRNAAQDGFAPMQAMPQPQMVAPTAGAIYSESAGGLALFQDNKARQPGDLLTIQLVENTTATTKATTTTSKDSSSTAGASSVLGGAITLGGRNLMDLDVSGEHAFTGSGASAQSNSLAGNITVTVMQRLPNGNLLVRGNKNLRLNQSNETVQIQGIVRTADIAPDNTVASSRLADVHILYGGRGPVAKSNVMGWLSRFFQSPAYPM